MKSSRSLCFAILLLLTQISFAQTKTFKSNLFPVTFSLSEEWTAEDKEEYKKIILTHKEWGPLYVERVTGVKIDRVYSYLRKTYFDSTGKVEHHFDFSEGVATVNGKAAKYIVGIWKNGNATNGLWTDLHYLIRKSDTEFYYFKAYIRANAKEKFLTAINSFVIL